MSSSALNPAVTTELVIPTQLRIEMHKQVTLALQEDIATGDINAQLIPSNQTDTATIICREPMVMAGRAWVETVFAILDPTMQLDWQAKDGDKLAANQVFL